MKIPKVQVYPSPLTPSSTAYNRRSVEHFPAIAVFLFGLTFGSFLNVCIYRMPRGLSVVAPRSACPGCAKPIAFYDNIPVLSWIILGGRCRGCRTPISPRYALVEVLTALLWLGCYAEFGVSFALVKWAAFSFLLLGLVFTDAETMLLPDLLTLPGLVLGLTFALFVPVNDLVSQLAPGMVQIPLSSDLTSHLWSFADAILGSLAGAGFIYGVGEIYYRARGVEGMGFGDVKLMGMIGAFLGLKLTIFTIFAASVAGSLFGLSTMLKVWIKRTRRYHAVSRDSARARAWQSARLALRHHQMPFGVFLGGMAMVALFFGNQFLHWYWKLL
jgi:leader peptidase (prepilin peptidase) / N-methyltransferase